MAEYTDKDKAFLDALRAERKAETAYADAQQKMNIDNSTNGQLVAAASAALQNAKKLSQDLAK